MALKILAPSHGEKAYSIAADTFCRLYKKITGVTLDITDTDDGLSDLVVIGSDAVNDTLAFLMLDGKVKSLGIRYGTDSYCIRAVNINDRKMLILAGGRGRSTIYAVYRFFEKNASCRYFYDGDIIPAAEKVNIEDIDISECPRFDYRGLRYFAHRGLARFQAEHWSEEDWKHELDWMLKKRLNFFMLRIGNDDLFQRAFPDIVKYPSSERDPDYDGFHDRTPFWDLEYRGKLRERVFEYAADRELMSPSDCGTMTHWYSRTPQEYIDTVRPALLDQTNKKYPDTIQVWDIREQKNLDAYMKLTETEVREFTKSEHLFHTIGLAERNMLPLREDNLRLKLFTYRRIAQSLRERFPNSKLFVASWDFVGWWKSDEVKALLKELDPERTVILDYTSDGDDPDTTFLNWGLMGNFPWVFGIFHAYEGENTLRGPYKMIAERLKTAVADDKCIGMIFWPEMSHSDPLMLEYICQNSWSPDKPDVGDVIDTLCADRYGKNADAMHRAWTTALPVLELTYWTGYTNREKGDPDWEKYVRYRETHRNLWHYPAFLPNVMANEHIMAHIEYKCALYDREKGHAVDSLISLLDVIESDDPMTARDALDIARTVIDVYLNHIFASACLKPNGRAKGDFTALMDVLCKLLSSSDDFSLNYTMKKINEVRPVAPSFETTLKNNAENQYCRQQCYEVLKYSIAPECEMAFDWLNDADRKPMTADSFKELFSPIRDKFYAMPLADMKCTEVYDKKQLIKNAAEIIGRL